MQKRTKIAIWTVFSIAVVAAVIILAISFNRAPIPSAPLFLDGAVITESDNPHKQAPLPKVEISATAAGYTTRAQSDGSGYFHLPLAREWKAGQQLTVTFRAENFEPLQQTFVPDGTLYIARLTPLPPGVTVAHPQPVTPIHISNVRIRYSTEMVSTTNIGSIAPTIDVPNTGNMPCESGETCSPDGRWRAALVHKTLDAGPDNQFVSTRVSCIAGPCPFTKLENENFRSQSRTIQISIRNWSGTTTFLVEAEVTRTQRNNFVRESYPAIFGQAMTFTLPPAAQGLSILAELNGHAIVFPIGPALHLSWAACNVEKSADGGRLFRCELKPPYQFQQSPGS